MRLGDHKKAVHLTKEETVEVPDVADAPAFEHDITPADAPVETKVDA